MSSLFGGSGSSSTDAAQPRGMPSFPFPCPESNLRSTISVLHGDERSQRAQRGSHVFCEERACPRECAGINQRSWDSHVPCFSFDVVSNHRSFRKQTTSASRNVLPNRRRLYLAQ